MKLTGVGVVVSVQDPLQVSSGTEDGDDEPVISENGKIPIPGTAVEDEDNGAVDKPRELSGVAVAFEHEDEEVSASEVIPFPVVFKINGGPVEKPEAPELEFCDSMTVGSELLIVLGVVVTVSKDVGTIIEVLAVAFIDDCMKD